MAALAEVVHAGVHHERAAYNGMRAVQRDLVVHNVDDGDAVSVGGNVAQVAGVALLVRGRAVVLAPWVKVPAARRAAVGSVAELVDVEAVLAFFQPADFALNASRAVLARGEEPFC